MIRALLWKECREYFFKLLAICGILALFGVLFFSWDLLGPHIHDLAVGLFFPTCWVLPVWLAACTVTSEKSGRTAAMLAAMPLRTPLIFLIKTLVALFTLLVPLSILIFFATTNQRSLLLYNEWLGLLVGMTSLYLMIIALTASLERETAVAMWGILLLLSLFICALLPQYVESEPLRKLLLAPNPLTPFMNNLFGHRIEPHNYEPHFIQLAFAVFWGNIALVRNTLSPKSRSRETVATGLETSARNAAPKLKLPHSSIFRALAWREFREQGWIIIAAGIAGMLFAVVISTLTARYSGYSPGSKVADTAHMFSECTLSLSILIPSIVAIILGVSSWSTDLHSKLVEFWRSRPIPAAAIFWSKFLASLFGILALLIMFAITSRAAAAYAHTHGLPFNYQTDVSNLSDLYTMAPLALTAILAGTIAITLLVRHSLYAAILALLAVILTAFAIIKVSGNDNILFHDIQIFLALTTAAALMFSYRALTRNWQFKPSAA